MSDIFSGLEYLLVSNPTIENFSWIPGKTMASSPTFPCFIILIYLLSIFILTKIISPPSIPKSILKPISALHNTSLLLLSFIMALGCLLSAISRVPRPHLQWIICFPPGTKPAGPLFFWAYIFYLSKILELVDTLLIILSSSSIRRLTFLHVYHHATVLVLCYIWLQTSQTMFPVVLIANASVHVLMYAYYLSCALGARPRWKKLVTNCQIMQFYSFFFILVVMLYFHITTDSGCSGVWGWAFSVIFNTSLLHLFLDFHRKNYGSLPISCKEVGRKSRTNISRSS